LKLSFLFFLSFYATCIIPQHADTIYVDTHTFLNTGKALVTSPLSFRSTDYYKLTGAVLVAGGSFLLDHEFKAMAVRNRSEFNRHLVNADRYYYVPTAAVLAGGIYLYGYIFSDNDLRHLGLDLGEAAFYASITNIGLKFISGRSRPLRTDDNDDFNPFQKAPIHSAFASAHTTLAFAVSTVMSAQSDNIIWKAGWYTAAGLVGAARIYRRMHWFSDVVMGSLIGYYIGSFVIEENSPIELSLLPGGLGLRLNL
jgi:membrane-associated phospholipid phosphatase